MGTGRRAAVGVVTKGMDMDAPLGVGVVARDVPRDSDGRVLVGLLKGDGARDLGVSPEDGDWRDCQSILPEPAKDTTPVSRQSPINGMATLPDQTL